ncbi:MAG: hypothetical protein ONB31_03695 [candidate division KSB1 bacterium]|nr:hypothetical protein [candidate division KSB1 bacterium]MDZ7334192.1 hypothetical protein [candidate division KSB1 bacterium]MDZ7357479.1 hypothetical protein [candidate division KSB1 bacterium]MDZ7400885.1 hypothetical protein [candidate division KSB1 bacterium]
MENITLECHLNTLSKIELLNYITSLERKRAQQSDCGDLLLELGIVYHHLAQTGDKSALEDCKEVFRELNQQKPDDPIVLAYLGNILTWCGNLESAVHKKLKLTKQGIDSIDRAVALTPDNLAVRWVRAMNSYHLPSFFGRLEISRLDFEYIMTHPDFRRWSKEQQAMIYYRAGLTYKKDDDLERATQYFHQAMTIAPESDWAKKAEQEWKAQNGKVAK